MCWCGRLTLLTHSLTHAAENFIYNRSKPSIKLQAFFRRHFNNVTFIEGSVLDIDTLKLAKVSAKFTSKLY